jgi:hypothetical protein
MYNNDAIQTLVKYIAGLDGIGDKEELAQKVQEHFSLTKDGSVYYGDSFAIRFCSAKKTPFGNTVLALSRLQKYDTRPFLVCIVTPEKNVLHLANTTFLKKISHSSHRLRCDNIRGCFNGSDIFYDYNEMSNHPNAFEELFAIHENFSFEENLERLVEATNQIIPRGSKFIPTGAEIDNIYRSVERSISFVSSPAYQQLNEDLYERVRAVESEIAIASCIDNVNLRGRVIEYLITETTDLKQTLMDSLRNNAPLPDFFTSDDLGDYERIFPNYHTKTDIKTKILFLSSNPKGFNIDKLLSFLAHPNTVYLIYILTIDSDRSMRSCLCPVYDQTLLANTRILYHWAGRNSRGVTQYNGEGLKEIVLSNDHKIDPVTAQEFLMQCLNL